jgi:hypothetical protein
VEPLEPSQQNYIILQFVAMALSVCIGYYLDARVSISIRVRMRARNVNNPHRAPADADIDPIFLFDRRQPDGHRSG